MTAYFCALRDIGSMNVDPQKKGYDYTPEDVKKLAKFFGLLWETQKEMKGCYGNKECNYCSSIAK